MKFGSHVSAPDLLHATVVLRLPVPGEEVASSQRVVAVLVGGVRYGTGTSQSRPLLWPASMSRWPPRPVGDPALPC